MINEAVYPKNNLNQGGEGRCGGFQIKSSGVLLDALFWDWYMVRKDTVFG